MLKSKLIVTSGLILLLSHVFGQTLKKQFDDLDSKKDTLEQQKLLVKWENANSNDPELYIAYFNYYVNKSRINAIGLGSHPKGDDALQLTGIDSSNKNDVIYLSDDALYNPATLTKGFVYIDKGIQHYPNRLDMRFGKIYMLGELKEYEKFTTEIIKAVDYSAVIKNKWNWADGKPLDEGETFMLQSLQNYQMMLYNTENNDLLDNMRRIAEAVLKYYPNHVESLSNLSIVYLLKKQYDKALVPLLKAEKIAPTDFIVLNNIAYAYRLKNDKANAIKYYELALKNGDEEAKKQAQEQIDMLKK